MGEEKNSNKAIMIAITIITIVLMSVLLVIAVTIIRLKMDNNNLTSSVQMLKDKLIVGQPADKKTVSDKKQQKQVKTHEQQIQESVEELQKLQPPPMSVEEDEKSLPEQQIEELTKKEDSKTAKLSQELEKMSGATGSKDRPLVKEMPASQGLL